MRLLGGSCGEAHELVFASVPLGVWDKGPAAANAWVMERLPPTRPVVPGQQGILSPGLSIGESGPIVTVLQAMLQKEGSGPDQVDGKFGPLTREALLAYQADKNLAPTGVADAETLVALAHQGENPLTDQQVSNYVGPVQEINDRKSLEAWLSAQNRETAIAIAVRAALRVAPLAYRIVRKGVGPQQQRELAHVTGAIFRALASARMSVQDPDRTFILSARNAAGAGLGIVRGCHCRSRRGQCCYVCNVRGSQLRCCGRRRNAPRFGHRSCGCPRVR